MQESGQKPTLTVVLPCYNEEENIREIHQAIARVLEDLERYEWSILFIDNSSTDRTVEILREICAEDARVKVIVNSRNFGIVRSPFYGLLQSTADVTIFMASDFQDPPELIPRFLEKWEEGFKSVIGVKKESEEPLLIGSVRRLYYRVVNRLSEMELHEGFTGFGLYDKTVLELLRSFDDPYPYFRGMISEIGLSTAKVEYIQPGRRAGATKNRFYHLFDMAMLGVTSHTKVPLRLATMLGFLVATLSLLVGLVYFVYKLVFWDRFDVGVGPLVIGIFFIGAVQLFFIGIIGEYIGSIHTRVAKRPLVVEKERINFGRDVVREPGKTKMADVSTAHDRRG